jgi:TonB family protein
MRVVSIIFFAFFVFIGLASAQYESQVNFDVSGRVRSHEGYSLPYAMVVFDREGRKSQIRTDINGEFTTSLFHGSYVITIEGVSPSNFMGPLRVGKEMTMSPLELVVDFTRHDEATAEYPEVEKIVTPNYPPAARAVRAEGFVRVEATLSGNGDVIKATVLDGHPLLRQAAAEAVRKWIFQAEGTERTVIVTFVFISQGERKENTVLNPNPYFQYIVAPRVVLNY